MRRAPKPLRYTCHQKLRNQMIQRLVKRDVVSACREWVEKSLESLSERECGRSRQAEIGGGGVFKGRERGQRQALEVGHEKPGMSGATWHFRPWDRAGEGLRGCCHTSSKLQRQDRVKGVEKKDYALP